MLQHPTELLRAIHEEDFLAERIELQAEALKGLLFKDGVCDVGRGVTDNYTLEAVLKDQQDEYLFKNLAALWMSKDTSLDRHQAVNKLINYLDSMVEEAASFQAKHILGVAK